METMKKLSVFDRKLSVLASYYCKGEGRFSVRVREDDSSYWSRKQKLIQIGANLAANGEGIDESILKGLLIHETGHIRFTTDYRQSVPHTLVNIFEDARIEDRQSADFGSALLDGLGKKIIDIHYSAPETGKVCNPYNLCVVFRQEIRGNVSPFADHAEFSRVFGEESARFPREFFDEAKEAIRKGIKTKDTGRLAKVCHDFYLKWKDLFDAFDANDSVFGTIELDGLAPGKATKRMTGKEGVSDEESDEPGLGSGEREYFDPKGKREKFAWDENLIQREAKAFARYITGGIRKESFVGRTGKRFLPHRLSVPTLSLYRTTQATPLGNKDISVLIVVDGSGSMEGEPYEAACHVSRIVEASRIASSLSVVVTNSNDGPFWIRNLLHMNRIKPDWSEGFVGIEKDYGAYDLVFFLTDAQIDEADQAFIQRISRDRTPVIGVYVAPWNNPSIIEGGERIFRKFLHTETLENIGTRIGLLIRRYKAA